MMLPEDVNQDQVFTTVQKLSYKYGVSVSNMIFREAVDQEEYSELPVSITLQGDYSKVMAMLEDLTTGDRLVQLDSLSLQSLLADEGIISAQAEAQIYFQ
jgi:Tfp pilus assembly protein PilO